MSWHHLAALRTSFPMVKFGIGVTAKSYAMNSLIQYERECIAGAQK